MKRPLQYVAYTSLSVSFMLLGASVVHNYYQPDLKIGPDKIKAMIESVETKKWIEKALYNFSAVLTISFGHHVMANVVCPYIT